MRSPWPQRLVEAAAPPLPPPPAAAPFCAQARLPAAEPARLPRSPSPWLQGQLCLLALTMNGLLSLLSGKPAAVAALCAAALVTALLHAGKPGSPSRSKDLLAWLATRLAARLPRQAREAAGRGGSAAASCGSSRHSSCDGVSEPGSALSTPRLPGEQPHWRVSHPAAALGGGGASSGGGCSGGSAPPPSAADGPILCDDMMGLYLYSQLPTN